MNEEMMTSWFVRMLLWRFSGKDVLKISKDDLIIIFEIIESESFQEGYRFIGNEINNIFSN